MNLRPRTLDDRGTPVRLHWRGLIDVRPARGPRPASSRKLARVRHVGALARHSARNLWRGIFSMPAFFAVLLVTLAIVFAWSLREFGPQAIAFVLFSPVSSTILLVAVTALITFRGALGARGERIRDGLLHAGRCPVCLYPLEDLEPEPDRCTVCPECGAAWRLDTLDAPVQRVVIREEALSHDQSIRPRQTVISTESPPSS
ncbi:MAG: hypothetical protein SFY95_08325 [Planctomycetota bacterium]|nr:hypothetical protein [Planctomycetota bacterium]